MRERPAWKLAYYAGFSCVPEGGQGAERPCPGRCESRMRVEPACCFFCLPEADRDARKARMEVRLPCGLFVYP